MKTVCVSLDPSQETNTAHANITYFSVWNLCHFIIMRFFFPFDSEIWILVTISTIAQRWRWSLYSLEERLHQSYKLLLEVHHRMLCFLIIIKCWWVPLRFLTLEPGGNSGDKFLRVEGFVVAAYIWCAENIMGYYCIISFLIAVVKYSVR